MPLPLSLSRVRFFTDVGAISSSNGDDACGEDSDGHFQVQLADWCWAISLPMMRPFRVVVLDELLHQMIEMPFS